MVLYHDRTASCHPDVRTRLLLPLTEIFFNIEEIYIVCELIGNSVFE